MMTSFSSMNNWRKQGLIRLEKGPDLQRAADTNFADENMLSEKKVHLYRHKTMNMIDPPPLTPARPLPRNEFSTVLMH